MGLIPRSYLSGLSMFIGGHDKPLHQADPHKWNERKLATTIFYCIPVAPTDIKERILEEEQGCEGEEEEPAKTENEKAIKEDKNVFYCIPRSQMPQSDRMKGVEPEHKQDKSKYENKKYHGNVFYVVPRSLLPGSYEERNGKKKSGNIAMTLHKAGSLKEKLEKHQSLSHMKLFAEENMVEGVVIASVENPLKHDDIQVVCPVPVPVLEDLKKKLEALRKVNKGSVGYADVCKQKAALKKEIQQLS
jgi:hypothetical protein